MNWKTYWYGMARALLVLLLLSISAACGNLIPVTGKTTGNTLSLSDCYQIKFLGITRQEKFVSTWRYRVEELGCEQDLTAWMMEIPACATVLEADPSPWKATQPDPAFQENGILWQKEADFHGGDFSIKLLGSLTRGTIRVGVMGTNIFTGSIQGPVCDLTISMPTSTFTATNTPTATNTATPTNTLTATVTPTPTSSRTEIPAVLPTKRPRDNTPTRRPISTSTTAPTNQPASSPTVENTPVPTEAATSTPVDTPTVSTNGPPTLPPVDTPTAP